MKTNRTIHVLLAGIGVASLLVYILACSTAFSPDDRQVLYPSYDPQSGALSIAVYDRNTRRSEQIFSGMVPHTDTNLHSASLRAEWLPDGKHILVAEAEEPDRLSLFVLPRGGKEPIRHISIPDWDESRTALQLPFAIIGTKVFLNAEHGFARLDWVTGEVLANTNRIFVMPSQEGKTLIGWRDTHDQGAEFGVIDPETLIFQPQLILTNQTEKGAFPAFHPREHEIMFLNGEGTNQELQIMRDGVKQFARHITRPGYEVGITSLQLYFGSKKECVFTTYLSKVEGQTNYECGLLEIPLSDKPLRFTPLFQVQSDEMVSVLAQASLSHDGKTWAISSAWLAAKNKSALRPEDCALFLVDVNRSQPKITKVQIVLPTVGDEGLN